MSSAGVATAPEASVAVKQAAVDELQQALSEWLAPLKMKCSRPFLAGWYNDQRKLHAWGSSTFDAADDVVGFSVYSVPGFVDQCVDYFIRNKPSHNDFVDGTNDEILDWMRELMDFEQLDTWIVNIDKGPPYYHVQTLGAVCGMDQHIEPSLIGNDEWRSDLEDELEDTRNPKMWGADPAGRRKIFGVNIHPAYGGWYAYRGIILMKKFRFPELPKPELLNFITDEDAMRIVSEFNTRHERCQWRDLKPGGHGPEHTYTPGEFFFFLEKNPAQRRKYIEIAAAYRLMGERSEEDTNISLASYFPSFLLSLFSPSASSPKSTLWKACGALFFLQSLVTIRCLVASRYKQ